MGIKSYTLEIKTKKQWGRLTEAMDTLPQALDFDPLFSVVGSMSIGKKRYALVSINCSYDSVSEVLFGLKKVTKMKTMILQRLEDWDTEYMGDNRSKIVGATYQETEEEFLEILR